MVTWSSCDTGKIYRVWRTFIAIGFVSLDQFVHKKTGENRAGYNPQGTTTFNIMTMRAGFMFTMVT